jgi:hypothetical protein
MNDIKSLLTNNKNPQTRLMEETRQLRGKWEKTGLLEGLKSIDQANMSILLENQAQQLLGESTSTGTSANSEQWAGVALPLVRRVFAEIAAKEFVSVQPMNLPSGLIFYLDFKYGTSTNGRTANVESLFGGNNIKLGSTDDAVNGLYGAGTGYYSVRQTSSLKLTTVVTGSTTDAYYGSSSVADLQYDSTYTSASAVLDLGLYTVKFGLKDNGASAQGAIGIVNSDMTAVRGWLVSGSGIQDTFGQFARVVNTGSLASPYYQAVLVFSGSPTLATGIGGAKDMIVFYTKQPDAQTRGDFEDTVSNGGGVDPATSIGIPEVNLLLQSEPIVAKTRKLKAVWTPELAQDLNAYHSIDAEAELTALLSEYVSMEIDLEILDMLISAAPYATTEIWSATIGTEITKTAGSTANAPAFTRTVDATNKTAYVKSTWFQTLGNKIQKVSNKIHQLTLRGGANFLVCSPDVATILESIPGYVVNTDGDSAKFAMGVSRVGSFASRFQVYKNPYMVENVILTGFRGNNFLETGAVYAPYIPLVQTPLVYDPVNFTPRRGVLTRYAKKVVRPEFYGKIYVADLNQV